MKDNLTKEIIFALCAQALGSPNVLSAMIASIRDGGHEIGASELNARLCDMMEANFPEDVASIVESLPE